MFSTKVKYKRVLILTKICGCFFRQNHGESPNSFLTKFALVNFQDTLNDIPDLERNYLARKRTPKMNLGTLKNISPILEKHFCYKKAFHRITQLRCVESDETNEKSNWEPARSYVETQCKIFETYYKHLREVILGCYLSIPNELHNCTPRGEDDIIVSENKLSFLGSKTTSNDHISIGSELGVLYYLNHSAYYLLKDAAVVEIAVTRFLSDVLEKEVNFRLFRNPDTCHEFIIEGAVVDNLDNECFRLEDLSFCLTGSASLSAFCAFRISDSVRARFLPERFYTYGPRYVPPSSLHEEGLYTVCQRTNVHLFVGATSEEQLTAEFNSTLHSLMLAYNRLGLDYRVCYARASELTLAERCRAKIQLFSPYRNTFVDVARLSNYGNFLSKRLRMFYHSNHVEKYILYTLDGVAISVPVLIANLLERSSDKMFIPDCIRPYMLSSISNKVDRN